MDEQRSNAQSIVVEQIDYPVGFKTAKETFEARYIRAALMMYGGNVSATAKFLNFGRRNLQLKINRYGIDLSRIRKNGPVSFSVSPSEEVTGAVKVLERVLAKLNGRSHDHIDSNE